jgi:hypothetical protein
MDESGCSLWPTATSGDGESSGSRNLPGSSAHHGTSLTDAAVRGHLWPTPCADDTAMRSNPCAQGGTLLSTLAGNWPTPRARDHKGSGPLTERPDGRSRMDQLEFAAEHWTPSLRPVQPIQDGPISSPERRTLNPLFVEWLMGWPIGWTACAPAATASSHWWRLMRGALSQLCSPKEKTQGQLL